MSGFVRYRAPSSSQLLAHIFETPALMAAVRELPAPMLVRLIDHVGIEDAGELVALASTEQLHEVFDEQWWHGASGDEERFSAERFALWLSIMSESGDTFVARRLSEMPVDMLTLAVSSLVLVLDLDALTLQLYGDQDGADLAEKALEGVSYEEWEEFALVGRDAGSWDVMWNALLSLDREHHALLREVLERCAWSASAQLEQSGGVYELLTELDVLEGQVADDRDDRRAARGYVSGPDAKAFLALCRNGESPPERDPITAAYFRRVSTEGTAGRAVPAQGGPAPDRTAALLQVMRDAEVLPAAEPGAPAIIGLLSSSSGAAGGEARRGFAQAMAALAAQQVERHAMVVEEVGYLANVLLAIRGRDQTARPVDALAAALSVCELGWHALVKERGVRTPDAGMSLLAELSADRVFRRGVRELSTDSEARAAPALGPWLPWLVAPEA